MSYCECSDCIPVDDEFICEHLDLIPFRMWDTGYWCWTCNNCYETIHNEWVKSQRKITEIQKEFWIDNGVPKSIVETW